MDVLAILGRGIQAKDATCDLSDMNSWVPTDDLEMCNENGAHLVRPEPVDDTSDRCLIGGGRLNLLAGMQLAYIFRPRIVVCAHGHQAPYLKDVDGPTESEVMCAEFTRICPESVKTAAVLVWQRHIVLPVRSNTAQELRNICDLALVHECKNIGIVTVGVHLPRTMMFAQRLLWNAPEYRGLSLRFFESEEVVSDRGGEHTARVAALRGSQAQQRTLAREMNGIKHLMSGTY